MNILSGRPRTPLQPTVATGRGHIELAIKARFPLHKARTGQSNLTSPAIGSLDLEAARHVATNAHQHAHHLLPELLGRSPWVVVEDILLGNQRGQVVEQGAFILLD